MLSNTYYHQYNINVRYEKKNITAILFLKALYPSSKVALRRVTIIPIPFYYLYTPPDRYKNIYFVLRTGLCLTFVFVFNIFTGV